jgi:hypothetical protein
MQRCALLSRAIIPRLLFSHAKGATEWTGSSISGATRGIKESAPNAAQENKTGINVAMNRTGRMNQLCTDEGGEERRNIAEYAEIANGGHS